MAILDDGGRFVDLLEACDGNSEIAVDVVLRWSARRRAEDKVRTTEVDSPSMNKMLPPEMLHQVFSNLAPVDLKTVLLVCKQWNSAASSPSLWTWVSFNFDNAPFRTPCLLKTMRLDRLQSAKGIVIRRWMEEGSQDSWFQLLYGILQHQGLKSLTLDANIADADAGLLAKIFPKMEEVEITLKAAKHMTNQQRLALSKAIQGPNRLKKLLVDGNRNFVALEASTNTGLLMKALTKITCLRVALKPAQVNLFLRKIESDKECSLQSLSLTLPMQLGHFLPSSFFAIFDKLEEIHLLGFDPPPFQHLVTSLCEALASERSRVKRLSLGSFDLSQVDPELLGRMVAPLEELSLKSMTGELDYWILVGTQMRKEQIETILRSARNMKKLEMNVSFLAEVDPELLAVKVNLLEEFRTSKLTRTQFEKILTRAVNGTSLKTLYLKWPFAENNVFRNLCTTPTEDINEDLISEARKVIPFVDF